MQRGHLGRKAFAARINSTYIKHFEDHITDSNKKKLPFSCVEPLASLINVASALLVSLFYYVPSHSCRPLLLALGSSEMNTFYMKRSLDPHFPARGLVEPRVWYTLNREYKSPQPA